MSVYIQLFHGRKDPDASMDDWGEDGPTLGPFEYVQMTYFQTVRLGLPDGGDGWLKKVDDMIYYNGMYYGDIDIVSSKNDRDVNTRKAQQFDEKLSLREGDEPHKPDEDEDEDTFECCVCDKTYSVEEASENDPDECAYCAGEKDKEDDND